jgi:glycerol-3-phosphate acyltransferase PlsX
LDFREYGGACLLGVNGNVIKAHGRSQAHAFKNAIIFARQVAESNIYTAVKREEKDVEHSTRNG